MKRLLWLCAALLSLSAPALAFSISQRLDATYQISLDSGWDFGIQGQVFFSPNNQPANIPLAISYRIRPFIRFTTDLIDNDEMSLSAYVRARLAFAREVVPAPIQPLEISFNLQTGLEYKYYLSEKLSANTGLEFDAEFTEKADYSLSGFAELSLDLGRFSWYGGVSLDEILPSRALSLYAGLTADLTSMVSLNLEGAYDLGRDDFILAWRVFLNFD
jgi:hypothetical protein